MESGSSASNPRGYVPGWGLSLPVASSIPFRSRVFPRGVLESRGSLPASYVTSFVCGRGRDRCEGIIRTRGSWPRLGRTPRRDGAGASGFHRIASNRRTEYRGDPMTQNKDASERGNEGTRASRVARTTRGSRGVGRESETLHPRGTCRCGTSALDVWKDPRFESESRRIRPRARDERVTRPNRSISMEGSPRFGRDSSRVCACLVLTILFAVCRMDTAVAAVAGIAAIPGGGNVPGGGRRAGGMSCADVEDTSMQCGLYEGLPQFNCPEACQGQWTLYNETEWLLSQEEPCTQVEQYFLQLDRCAVDAASGLGGAAMQHTILALSISIVLALMGNVLG